MRHDIWHGLSILYSVGSGTDGEIMRITKAATEILYVYTILRWIYPKDNR